MLRYLLNRLASEKVIEYLSQTYLIKRAAQMTVSTFYRISGDKRLSNRKIQNILDSFKGHLKEELEDMKREIKKNRK